MTKSGVRSPTVLQMEAVECGAAALAIVLAHYGRWVPLEELRLACGVSRDGSNARSVMTAARRYGLTAKAMRLSVESLRKAPQPCIVFWNFNHFLVVDGFERDAVRLNDPATGPRRVDHGEFDRSYTGVALLLEPGPDFSPGGKPPNVWRGLLRRIEGARLALVALTAAAVFAALPVAVAAILSRVFVDEVLVAGRTDWLPGLVAAAALAFLAHLAATATLETVLRRLEARLALGGASSLLWHVLRLPFAFFTQRAPEDVVDRLRSNDDAARTIVRTVGLTLARLAGAVLFVLLIAVLDVWIALVTVAFAALSIAVTVHAQRRLRDASAALKVHEAKVFADTAMAISAAETIKATGTQEATFVRWAGHHATALNVEQELGRLGAVLRALPPLTDSVSVALVLVLGALAVMAGDMTLGTLVAVVALLAAVREPVQALATMLAEIESVRAAFQRIDDVHNYDLDQTFAGDAPPPAAITGRARLAGRIELKDVTFGYSPLAPPLVKDFSLSIPPGGRVALVGGTGSGKSTIAKLVAGLYRPWSGAILLDGREPAEIPRWFLKTSIGWVDQDLTLFEGSVRDNLTLWDNSIPEATLARAARDAAIYETISARPGGFEHRVLEGGANFSGGQAQRLQIARAFALDPSIVVFDEATSALDPALEREIDLSLRRRGCTALIVAHRLSTIRDCDEIVVMDRGAIVERGTHEELMGKGGHYRTLVHA